MGILNLLINWCARVVEPVIGGFLFASLVLPGLDWGFAIIIAYFDRRRTNSIKLSEEKHLEKKLNKYGNMSIDLINALESNAVFDAMAKIQSPGIVSVFQYDSVVREGMVVRYNENTNKLEAIKHGRTGAGIFYKKISDTLALVLSSGEIVDQDYVNKHWSQLDHGSIKVNPDGSYSNTSNSQEAVGFLEKAKLQDGSDFKRFKIQVGMASNPLSYDLRKRILL